MTAAPTPIKTLLASAFLGWLISSFILFAIFKLQADQSSHPFAYDGVAIGLMIIFYSLAPTLGAAAILGPAWLKHAAKRGFRSLWTYLLAGLLRGAAVGAALTATFVLDFGVAWWSWAAITLPYSAAIGALTGVYAWLDLRPDRDAANPATPAP
jgi:hypothetical protein